MSNNSWAQTLQPKTNNSDDTHVDIETREENPFTFKWKWQNWLVESAKVQIKVIT